MTSRKMLGFAAVILAATVLTGFALDAAIGTSQASGPDSEEEWTEWDGTYWKCYVHIEEGAHVEGTNICSDGSTATSGGGASGGDGGDGGSDVSDDDVQESEGASCTMESASAHDQTTAQGDNSSAAAASASSTDAKQKCNNQEIHDSYNQDNDVTGSYNEDNDVTTETSSCSIETNETSTENNTVPERDGVGTASTIPNGDGYGGGNTQECNNEDNDTYSAECSAEAQLIALNNCQGRAEPEEPRGGPVYEQTEKGQPVGLLGLL